MTESVLTDEQIVEIVAENFELAHRNYDDDMILARVIESAVLQSPEVVAMRKDAARLDWLINEGNCTIRAHGGKFWLCWVDPTDPFQNEHQTNSFQTARVAIDAAMEAKP